MNYQRVDTAYAGEWSAIATRLQPVLTDPGFRKDSVETYRPRQQSVRQLHTGPDGTKEVRRTGRKIEVLDEDFLGYLLDVASSTYAGRAPPSQTLRTQTRKDEG